MSFQAKLETLRSKPEHVKKHIAFWSSFGITAMIFMFWLASFTSLGTRAQQTVATAVVRAGTPAQSLTAGVGNAANGLDALVSSVGNFFTDVRDLIFKPRTVKYTDVIVTPGN